MEALLNFLDTKHVDFFIFILVIASGYFQDRFLCVFTWYKKDSRYDATIKTFVVSLIFSAIYVWLFKYEAGGATEVEQAAGTPWKKIFISFACATSFYDLVLRLFKIELKKKTGIDADDLKK